uniref:Uncharacterized protein n=1 Tax=viral metagenome TaxID=1070528 RepID=A0A6C0EKQ0_9ZZZZ
MSLSTDWSNYQCVMVSEGYDGTSIASPRVWVMPRSFELPAGYTKNNDTFVLVSQAKELGDLVDLLYKNCVLHFLAPSKFVISCGCSHSGKNKFTKTLPCTMPKEVCN